MTDGPDAQSQHAKPIIGVAGGIGSGKSMIARQFESLGCARFDADAVAKAHLQDDDVKQQLTQWWGADVLDARGNVDRSQIAKIVFADPAERQRLESLIHPRVAADRQRMIESAMNDDDVCAIVLDVPLLFEAGVDQLCDRVVFVQANESTRAQRVAAHRGWTLEDLRQREENQWSLQKKLDSSTDLIDNNQGTVQSLTQVRELLTRICESF